MSAVFHAWYVYSMVRVLYLHVLPVPYESETGRESRSLVTWNEHLECGGVLVLEVGGLSTDEKIYLFFFSPSRCRSFKGSHVSK